MVYIFIQKNYSERKSNSKKKKRQLICYIQDQGFPSGASGKKPACQCRRQKKHSFFHPWVGKIP